MLEQEQVEEIGERIFKGWLIKTQLVDDLGSFILDTDCIPKSDIQQIMIEFDLDSIQLENGKLVVCFYEKE